jgi:UDP-N-acetylmuramyl tripeptide synthase
VAATRRRYNRRQGSRTEPEPGGLRPLGLRGLASLWLGKGLIGLLRLLRHGGSHVPGRAALALDPAILRRLGRRTAHGCTVVSGTNGKTTTAAMLAAALRAHGWSVTHNRSGANLVGGVAAAFVEAARMGGRGRDVAVVEVDEATMPAVARSLLPRVGVVTNFFRDQLDRYGELASAVTMVRDGLAAMPAGGAAVLNADDPLVASLGGADHLQVIYYGIELPAGDAGLGTASGAPGDVPRCLRCGGSLEYSQRFYAHLGRYACSRCGARRPEPQVALRSYAPLGTRGAQLSIATPAGPLEFRLGLRGLYNVYNALAAGAAALVLGLAPGTVAAALEGFSSSFGRMESIAVDGREAFLALVKNPVGFREVLRTVLEDPSPRKALLLALNDNYADGTDVSWVWDVDFEQLGARSAEVEACVVSGLRADDLALRLKYAGVPAGKVEVEGDLAAAFDAGLRHVPPGGTLYVLPTYTAMLGLRQVVSRRGLTRQFWEEG